MHLIVKLKINSMIKKVLLLPLVLAFFCFNLQAQTVEELKATKAEKQAQLDALTAEVNGLQGQIDAFPGWKVGGVGTLGFNINSNNDWFAIANPNSSATGLGLGFTGFANLDEDKFFWRNGLNINLNRITAYGDKDVEATKSVALADLLDFASLFGYKLNDKLAVSAEVKWLSSLIELNPNGAGVLDDDYSFSLNSPGQLTASAGITWTPISDLVVLIHPLGFQQNWPGDFISSPGAKIGATYTKELFPGLKWNSSLSAFVPYTSGSSVGHADAADVLLRTVDYKGGDLVNWLWNNGFSFTVWKGVGVGLNVGMRGDSQIADQGRLRGAATEALALDPTADAAALSVAADAVDLSSNPLQLFWNLGLSYSF